MGHVAERLSHHVATHALIQPATDQAFPFSGKDGLSIAAQDGCGENVEEARVGQRGIGECPSAAVLQNEFLIHKLVGPPCAHLYLRYISA